MNGGLDFALAQVRDRDLVIESLREQLAGTGAACKDYEKWLDDALAALGVKTVFEIKGAKERAVAAEAKLAEANERLDEFWHEAQEERAAHADARRYWHTEARKRKAAEAKLAEVTDALNAERAWIEDGDEDDCRARLAEAEAKLAEDAHRNDQLKRERDKYQAKLAEVEKELEELRKGDT